MILIKKAIVRTTVLCCCIAVLLFGKHSAVSLITKKISDIQRMAEAEAFIKELFEAQTNKDVYWIRERLNDDDVIDWAVMLCVIYSDDFGFRKYDNMEVRVFTTSNEDYLLAVFAYDLVIEWNGEEVALPGWQSFVVWQNENSQWCIAQGLSDELADEVYQMLSSDELADWFNSISAEFSDILIRRPELASWLSEMRAEETARKIISETLMKNDTWDENDVWDYLFGEESGILTASFDEEEDSINIYIVRKGDCLWSIAEREFGDGMFWIKLYEANRDVIGQNPDLLCTGTELDLVYEED